MSNLEIEVECRAGVSTVDFGHNVSVLPIGPIIIIFAYLNLINIDFRSFSNESDVMNKSGFSINVNDTDLSIFFNFKSSSIILSAVFFCSTVNRIEKRDVSTNVAVQNVSLIFMMNHRYILWYFNKRKTSHQSDYLVYQTIS